MLNPKDRLNLELQIIHGLLIYHEEFFLPVYEFNPNAEDVFSNKYALKLYPKIIEYYVESGRPSTLDIFNELIIENADEELKNFFTTKVSVCEPINDMKIIYRLIEDSIEKEARQQIAILDKKKLTGLGYAEMLREKIDEIILSKFERYGSRDNRSNEEKLTDLIYTIEQTREGKASDYIPTGFSQLDENIIGIPKSHLTTIAGRPGQGKTSFLLQLRRNFCERRIKPLIISLEMTTENLLIKDLSAYSEIDSRMIETGRLTNNEMELLRSTAKQIGEQTFFVEDDSWATVQKIKSIIRRHLIKNKIDIVMIDYLTLVKLANRGYRYDLLIGELTNELREFAKDTKLPIVILSQLNREVERRADKRPMLSDLRESGSIEQDSKTVLFLYRPGYYGIDYKVNGSECYDGHGNPVEAEDYFEVIIGKARNGKIGVVPLKYIAKLHKFEDVHRRRSAAQVPEYDNWYERKN